MTRPTVSFLCSSYNHAQFLTRALDGMLQQTWSADEVIVIEDCSTDHTREILENYAARHPQLRVIYNDKNQGVLKNMRTLISLASTDYICWTSSDDYLLPDFLDQVMSAIARHPGVGLGACEQAYFSTHHSVPVPLRELLPSAGFARFGEYLSPADVVCAYGRDHLWLATNATVIRRESISALGGYRPSQHAMIDVFMMYAVAFRDGIALVPKGLAAYRLATGSFSGGIKQKSRGYYYYLLKRFFACAHKPKLQFLEKAFHKAPLLAFSFGKEIVFFFATSPRYFLTFINLVFACLFHPKMIWNVLQFKRKLRIFF